MVNTFKEIVQKQDGVLRRKAEKIMQRSHKRVHTTGFEFHFFLREPTGD